MVLNKFIHKLKCTTKSIVEIYKYGGIRNVNISYLTPDKQLENKTVLITGGGSGIGKSIAEASLRHGAKVIISGRNEQRLKDAVNGFKQEGLTDIKYMVLDISNVSGISECVNSVSNLFGCEIDILVNNAGMQPQEFFPAVSENEWDKIYATNSKGTFFISQEFCKHWIRKGLTTNYRKIINISSQGGFVGATYPYRMSKWDIVGLTEGLSKIMASHNIIVNGIAPGVVRTEMQQKYMEQKGNVYCNQNPMQRFAFPEEIAELAIFLMSDRSNFITGQTIICDGGFTLK